MNEKVNTIKHFHQNNVVLPSQLWHQRRRVKSLQWPFSLQDGAACGCCQPGHHLFVSLSFRGRYRTLKIMPNGPWCLTYGTCLIVFLSVWSTKKLWTPVLSELNKHRDNQMMSVISWHFSLCMLIHWFKMQQNHVVTSGNQYSKSVLQVESLAPWQAHLLISSLKPGDKSSPLARTHIHSST